MNFKAWYKRRGPLFIAQRGLSLLDRYSLGTKKAAYRIKNCLATLADLDCLPTFFTPANIVRRNPAFIHSLQEAGAEIAIHGYHHINLEDLSREEAGHQLLKSMQTFKRFGIKARGFRCPYIGCSEELLDSLPSEMFDYSSNQPIFMDVTDNHNMKSNSLLFNTLSQFYRAQDSSKKLCLPWMRSNMLEIPLCVPDDLQLRDGWHLDQGSILNIWDEMLQQTHQRGELFSLIFHTEMASIYDDPFAELVRHARQYEPAVWIARLAEINDWWREKATFRIETTPTLDKIHLSFICSPRATILARGLDIGGLEAPWDGMYSLLESTSLEVPAIPRPFVGLDPHMPEKTISFLHDQGYIVDTGDTAVKCGIYLDATNLTGMDNEVQLINHIETSSTPLVRYWRWPNGAKSALCITGDLDALSLLDYASRLFIKRD